MPERKHSFLHEVFPKLTLLQILDLESFLQQRVGEKSEDFLMPGNYQSSPSFSLAGTSITLGLSMILAVLFPFSTMPMIQAW